MDVHQLFSRLHAPFEGRLAPFTGATEWLNTQPLTPADLQGKVVAVDFWTFTCINWLRTLPYIRAWAGAYAEQGLVVVGVHTPEFGVEHDIDNVRRAVRDMGIGYPVAVDNDYGVWNAFANQYWPALYIADAEGRLRHHHFGEGDYDGSERVIRHLLADAGAANLPTDLAPVEASGIEVAADWDNVRSPETYVGFARSNGFASPERRGIRRTARVFAAAGAAPQSMGADGRLDVELRSRRQQRRGRPHGVPVPRRATFISSSYRRPGRQRLASASSSTGNRPVTHTASTSTGRATVS